jgi:hypothetical protein
MAGHTIIIGGDPAKAYYKAQIDNGIDWLYS